MSTFTDILGGIASDLGYKPPCAAATTANVALLGLAAIDGYTPNAGDRILVWNQTNTVQNGIYNASLAAWTRSTDCDSAASLLQGTQVAVVNGTANGGYVYKVTTANPITVGTTSLAFAQSTFNPANYLLAVNALTLAQVQALVGAGSVLNITGNTTIPVSKAQSLVEITYGTTCITTLPAASTLVNQGFVFYNSSAVPQTIAATGGGVFVGNNGGGTGTFTLQPGCLLWVLGDGTNYVCVINTNPAAAVAQLAGYRNRIINGDMRIDQRNSGSAQTITAGAALAYTVDRWYAYSTGQNLNGQRVVGSGAVQNQYQFTGASGVTTVGFGQRIESNNSYDLAGQTCQLSVNLANSLLSTINWAVYLANSTDSFGTLASPTRTLIASGSFAVSSTLTKFTTPVAVPNTATTGIEVVFSVGAQSSGLWTIGNVQFEPSSSATTFEKLPITVQTQLCQRYYQAGYDEFNGFLYTGGLGSVLIQFPVQMRATPTVAQTNISNTLFSATPGNSNISVNGFVSQRTSTNYQSCNWSETWVATAEL